jgi:hypothetical protein
MKEAAMLAAELKLDVTTAAGAAGAGVVAGGKPGHALHKDTRV